MAEETAVAEPQTQPDMSEEFNSQVEGAETQLSESATGDGQAEDTEGREAPQRIKVGDEELTMDELQEALKSHRTRDEWRKSLTLKTEDNAHQRKILTALREELEAKRGASTPEAPAPEEENPYGDWSELSALEKRLLSKLEPVEQFIKETTAERQRREQTEAQQQQVAAIKDAAAKQGLDLPEGSTFDATNPLDPVVLIARYAYDQKTDYISAAAVIKERLDAIASEKRVAGIRKVAGARPSTVTASGGLDAPSPNRVLDLESNEGQKALGEIWSSQHQ